MLRSRFVLFAAFILSLPTLGARAQDRQRPQVPADTHTAPTDAPDLWFATERGWNDYQVSSISSREDLGGRFVHRVTVTVTDPYLDVAELIGHNVTVGVRSFCHPLRRLRRR